MPANIFSNPSATLSRRGLLAVTAGGLLVAGCGKGPGSNAKGVGGFTGKAYDGPKLELAYWNGFTGGDGPAMQALVKEFVGGHDKIGIKNNTVAVDRLLPAAPGRDEGRQGPGRRCDAPRPAGDERRAQRHRAAGRPGRGARPVRERLRARRCGDRASTRTSATASRSTCTRSRCTTTRTTSRRPASRRPRPTPRASTTPARSCRPPASSTRSGCRTSGRPT